MREVKVGQTGSGKTFWLKAWLKLLFTGDKEAKIMVFDAKTEAVQEIERQRAAYEQSQLRIAQERQDALSDDEGDMSWLDQ